MAFELEARKEMTMGWFSSKKSVMLSIDVDGMSCDGCVRALTKRLADTPGVEKVDVVLSPRGHVKILGTIDEENARSIIRKAGYLPV